MSIKISKLQLDLLHFYSKLEDAGVAVGVHATAKRLNVSSSGIQKARLRLKRDGLIDFDKQPFKRAEALSVRLTDKGKEIVKKLF